MTGHRPFCELRKPMMPERRERNVEATKRTLASMALHELQQARQRSRQPRFGLAALAKKDDVLARQEGVFHLWDDRFLEADNALELRLATLELVDQVVAQLFLDGSRPITRCF